MVTDREMREAYFSAPFQDLQQLSPELRQANAMAYLAHHAGRISASLAKIEARLSALEDRQSPPFEKKEAD